MISPEKLFGNLFDDPAITPDRLADCAQDSVNKFTAAGNVNSPTAKEKAKTAVENPYQVIIDTVQPPLTALQTQLGKVDTSLTRQRGATQTNDQVMTDLGNTMRDQQGVIANAVGGFKSAAFIQFYPHGLMEYTQATKLQMPTLVNRVNDAATAYSTQLGDTLTATLQGFAEAWQTSRDAQEKQMGTVSGNRTGRTQAETDLQLALSFAVHETATMFPGDVVQCSSFFDFSLLYSSGHRHKAELFNGNVAKGATAIALNRSLTETTHLKLNNLADNASLLVYLGATADAEPNGKGVEVDAGKSRNLKLSELGDENGTFLLIKNLSDVNDAGYTLEVKD